MGNNRILRFSSINAAVNGSSAEAVLGQTDFKSGLGNRGASPVANTLNGPTWYIFSTLKKDFNQGTKVRNQRIRESTTFPKP